jgi:hypothetical protein
VLRSAQPSRAFERLGVPDFAAGPRLLPDVQFFLGRVREYLQNLRDSNEEACSAFATVMFHDTEETAQPDILGAVLKKGLEAGVDKLVGAVAERIPGVDVVVGTS